MESVFHAHGHAIPGRFGLPMPMITRTRPAGPTHRHQYVFLSLLNLVIVIIIVLATLLACVNVSEATSGVSNGGNGGGTPRSKSSKVKLDELNDIKEWKKLIKTKTNVLILFISEVSGSGSNKRLSESSTNLVKVLAQVSEAVRGVGTIAHVNCASSSETKKLCKKVKVSENSGAVIKHFHNGEFNKDYDRAEKLSSFINFMKDPTGDLPWEEDSSATHVLHIPDPQTLAKTIKKESGRGLLIMFYAPWCGFCKKMKPDYAALAQELGEEGVIAAMDVNRPENNAVRQKYNITGFPTILYFRNGAMKSHYEGENNKAAMLAFMRNPDAPPVEKPKEIDWAEEPDAIDVVHLTSETFQSTLKEHQSVLVMFYAPWCGHCKRMKPAYASAATRLKKIEVNGILAAVDATKDPDLAKEFNINGYPTVKHFKDGEFNFDVNLREEEPIIEFMKNPTEPPPPPPPEQAWADEETAVVHLDEENFKSVLKRKKHALVMFYAPWCGHCKQIKPEFTAAAEELKDDPKVLFGAVDCTQHQKLCSKYDVTGFPTIKHFYYYDKEEPTTYDGGRTKQDLTHEATTNPSEGGRRMYTDWDGLSGSEHIHKLTDDNLTAFLKSREAVLLMFYAPWCGHCKAMKPDFARAAASLARDGSAGVLAAIDCAQYPRVTERHQIQGYPTLKYYRNGSFVGEYSRQRRAGDFIAFMQRKPKSRDEL